MRVHYLDNLKTGLTCLVILHHIAVAYGGAGALLVKDPASDPVSPIVLSLFTGINQSFFMSLFFFIAAYFTAASLQKKRPALYLRDRLKRLGIPLIGYVILISPAVRWIVAQGTGGSYSYRLAWHPGPLWFIETLLIFSMVYLVFRVKSVLYPERSLPKSFSIFGMIVLLAILNFAVRIIFPVGRWVHTFQPAYYCHYIAMFYFGILAYRYKWLHQVTVEFSRKWRMTAVISIICYPLIWAAIMEGAKSPLSALFGGGTWQSLVLSLVETTAMVSISISLVSVFKNRFNSETRLSAWLRNNQYGAFIVHISLIYICMIPLLHLPIPGIIKFVIVSTVAVPSSFIVSSLLRKLPAVDGIIG